MALASAPGQSRPQGDGEPRQVEPVKAVMWVTLAASLGLIVLAAIAAFG